MRLGEGRLVVMKAIIYGLAIFLPMTVRHGLFNCTTCDTTQVRAHSDYRGISKLFGGAKIFAGSVRLAVYLEDDVNASMLDPSTFNSFYNLFSGLFSLFFGIVLLVSVEKNQAYSMKRWIAGTVIHMLCAAVIDMVFAFYILEDSILRVAFLVSEIIGQALSGYFIIVVNSYSKAIIYTKDYSLIQE